MKEYKYDAQRVCGNGSFSIVFQAIVRQTNQEVAIKKLFHDKGISLLFLPTSSSELNPVEHCWAHIKHRVVKQLAMKDEE